MLRKSIFYVKKIKKINFSLKTKNETKINLSFLPKILNIT